MRKPVALSGPHAKQRRSSARPGGGFACASPARLMALASHGFSLARTRSLHFPAADLLQLRLCVLGLFAECDRLGVCLLRFVEAMDLEIHVAEQRQAELTGLADAAFVHFDRRFEVADGSAVLPEVVHDRSEMKVGVRVV